MEIWLDKKDSEFEMQKKLRESEMAVQEKKRKTDFVLELVKEGKSPDEIKDFLNLIDFWFYYKLKINCVILVKYLT